MPEDAEHPAGQRSTVVRLASGMILLGYGHRSSIMVLAWAVLAAGAVGGVLGSVRPREMISAGPPQSVETTGSPCAIASTTTFENDSERDDTAQTRARSK